MNNVLFGGIDTRAIPACPFVHYETLGGGSGAGPWRRSLRNSRTYDEYSNTPVESLEQHFPVLIQSYKLGPSDEKRQGQYSGGRGIERHYKFMTQTTVTVVAERHVIAPAGEMGRSWTSRHCVFCRYDGTRCPLPSKFTRTFEAGTASLSEPLAVVIGSFYRVTTILA